MKNPAIELRRYYKTDYADKSVFAANARLLQSIWRQDRGLSLNAKYGNFLDANQAYELKANFLTEKTISVVEAELKQNKKRKGNQRKVIKEDRLYQNLLASQPLAFNLFAELITPDFDIANKVFKSIYGDIIQNVTGIEFEISPGRGDEKYTGDRSAFDVFITYDGKKGNGFIAIEVKYAETLLDEPATFKNRYKEVGMASGKFTNVGIDDLCKMPVSIEQIWRDHLLSLSIQPPINSNFEEGFFVHLYPKDNIECINALAKYKNFLNSKDPFVNGIHELTIENLVNEIKKFTNDNWIRDFEDRYLKFEKIDNTNLGKKDLDRKVIKSISKLDAALEQLKAAIDLFQQGKFIPAITLAGASEEVIGQIFKDSRKNDLYEALTSEEEDSILFEMNKDFLGIRNYVSYKNRTKNELKHHGDENNKEVLKGDFKQLSLTHISGAIINYTKIYNELPEDLKVKAFCAKIGLTFSKGK